MAIDPITSLLEIGKTVLDKVLPDKMSEAEKANIKNAFEGQMAQQALVADKNFRDFILQYEGAAKDIPRVLVIFRSVIRPLFTVAVGYWDWLFFAGSTVAWDVEKVALLKAINLVVLFFWFGERAVTNSGVIAAMTKMGSKP